MRVCRVYWMIPGVLFLGVVWCGVLVFFRCDSSGLSSWGVVFGLASPRSVRVCGLVVNAVVGLFLGGSVTGVTRVIRWSC